MTDKESIRMPKPVKSSTSRESSISSVARSVRRLGTVSDLEDAGSGEASESDVVCDRESVKEEEEDEHSEEDADIDTRLARLSQVVEFKHIVDEDELFFKEDPPSLGPCPDIQELYRKVIDKIHDNFTPETVVSEIKNLHELLVFARMNETEILAKLKNRENQVRQLGERLKRDPRVARVLELADNWRKEKAEAEKISQQPQELDFELGTRKSIQQKINDYSIELADAFADHKSLEVQLASARTIQRKTYEKFEKAQKWEHMVDKLEEQGLKRESLMNEMKYKLRQLEDEMGSQILQHEREVGTLQYKLDSAPDRHAEALEDAKKRIEHLIQHLATCKHRVRDMQLEIAMLRHTERMAGNHARIVSYSLRAIRNDIAQREVIFRKVVAEKNVLKNDMFRMENSLKLANARLIAETQTTKKHLQVLEEQKNVINQMGTKLASESQKLVDQGGEIRLLKEKLHDMEIEVAVRHKSEARVTEDSKLCHRHLSTMSQKCLLEELHHTNTKTQLKKSRNDLVAATMAVTALMSNADDLHSTLWKATQKLNKCETHVAEDMNMVTHLRAVVKSKEDTIRHQDSTYDTLLVNAQQLGQLLDCTFGDLARLHQVNMTAASHNKNILELQSMLQHMLKFTETEKQHAVNEAAQMERHLVIMKKGGLSRLLEMIQLQKEISTQRDAISNLSNMVQHQKNEITTLMQTLKRAQFEEKRLKYLAHEATTGRNVFGAMVIQRNLEIQLLNKKMGVLCSLLDRGNTMYKDRLRDICVLGMEIKNLRRKNASYEATKYMNSELRSELVQTKRGMQLELSKRKALENMKVVKPHSNRQLMNSHPSEYEKVMKIQSLQKLLLRKVTALVLQEQLLAAREIEIKKLLMLVAVRPTPDCQLKLNDAQATIRDKNKTIKGLLAENNMLQFDAEALKKKANANVDEMKRLKEELAKLKRKIAFQPRPPPNSKTGPKVGNGFMIHSKSRTMTRTVTKRWMAYSDDGSTIDDGK